jgi:hypothetical protein
VQADAASVNAAAITQPIARPAAYGPAVLRVFARIRFGFLSTSPVVPQWN